MKKPEGYYAKWNKPEKGNIVWYHMWNLKKADFIEIE